MRARTVKDLVDLVGWTSAAEALSCSLRDVAMAVAPAEYRQGEAALEHEQASERCKAALDVWLAAQEAKNGKDTP